MSDELLLNGKQYVSSRRAAEETGYARDYIGQLSRAGAIDAERVGGLWYVSLESLKGYEKNADTARTFTPVSTQAKDGDSSLSFEGKEHISASRASKITGYNQDYVGQLARAGKIPSRQIGNRWYVDREALIQHKAEKDALLAAVQSESVGLRAAPQASELQASHERQQASPTPQLTYVAESRDLMPRIATKVQPSVLVRNFEEIRPLAAQPYIPESQIKDNTAPQPSVSVLRKPLKRSRRHARNAVVGILTIILVLSVGFASFKHPDTFASIRGSVKVDAMSAGAARAMTGIGDLVENAVSPLLTYQREQ